MNTNSVTRKELYDLVWATPMTSLAKKYLISDSGIRKICKRMDIPMPKAGHWEKIKAGKEVILEKLPANLSVEQQINLSLRPIGDISKVGIPTELSVLILEIENDSSVLLDVPEKLTNPHELVKLAKQACDETKKDRYLHDGLMINRDIIRFSVTPINVSRALALFDTLIKAVKSRNHTVDKKDNNLIFIVNKEEFKINLREKLKRVQVESKYSWDRYQKHPTGIFILTATGWVNRDVSWEDGKLPIEKQLAKIIATIEIKSRAVAEERKELEKGWAEQAELTRIKEEQKRNVDNELSAFRNILKVANRWHDARVLRDFIKEKESKANANNSLTEELKSEIEWALKKADWYDPTVESKDAVLKDADREKIVLAEKQEIRYFY